MSLLNLNTSAGRGPRGKKSLKMFMGAGLLVAVLGIGSTLAANITLNTPGGDTEFGQGITQTVYCGGDAVVNVSPTSSFSNGIKSYTTFKLVTPGSSGSEESVHDSYKTLKQTIYTSSGSRYPKFSSLTSTISGWWVYSSSSLTSAIITAALKTNTAPANYPVSFTAGLNAANWYFIQETSTNKFRTGTTSSPLTSVSVSDDPSNFILDGVVISKIPPACSGVNFVFSGYGDTGSVKPLVSTISVVAARWTQSPSGDIDASTDRTCLDTSNSVTASQNTTSLSFKIIGGSLSAKDLSKIVVETQEDVLTNNDCND